MRQQLPRALFGFLARHFTGFRLKHDVAERGAPFEQYRTLKHDADIGTRPVDLVAADLTVPLDAGISPAAIINSVLLPQPLGPTWEMNSPRCWLKETSLSARTSPSRAA